MKIVALVLVLLIVLVTFKAMNVTEGYSDSVINADIDKLNSIKSSATDNTLAIKNMKLDWTNHNKMVDLINKYSEPNAVASKKVTYDLTIDEAVQKLVHRRNTN